MVEAKTKLPVFALRGDGKVVDIDPDKDEIIKVIETGSKGSTLRFISKDGKYLYVANNAPNERIISVIDTQKIELLKNIETGNRLKHPLVSPDGALVAVNHSDMDGEGVRIVFISTSQNQVKTTVILPVSNKEHIGDFTMHGVWSPDGKFHSIGNYTDNKFYLIDRHGKIVSEIATSGNPHYFDWKGKELWGTVEYPEPKITESKPHVYIYDVSKPNKPVLLGMLSVEMSEVEKKVN